METPSSSRRITRSQTLSKKFEESEKATVNSRQTSGKNQNKHQDRSALVDITNDSPIVGLAMGNLETPSSAMSKKRVINQGQCACTPGSGEALLRGQVKTLLQKVEEEAELSKISFEERPFFNLQGLVCSPMNLMAPTPANTPQVLNFSDADDLSSLTASPVSEKFLIPQVFDEKKGDENLITRSLMLEFSDKSETYELSVVPCEGALGQGMESDKEKSSADDDDSSSIWSIQVNLSSPINDDDDDEEGKNSVEIEEEYGFGGGDDEGLVDELCEGMSKISVKEGPKSSGKHIRFLYDSDDEIQGQEDVCDCPGIDGMLRLKGLPTPKGKHLRFPEELEDK